MPLKQFAWMVHCNDEGAGNGRWQASLNWVMPWGADDGVSWHASQQTGGAPAGSDGKSVAAQVGDLLWPWKMRLDDWHAVREDGAAPTLAPVQVRHATVLADALDVQHKLEQEIRTKTGACPTPFSLDPDCLHNPLRPGCGSLPHAFAPLTHLPAPVAQGMLGLVTVVQFDDAVRAGCRALVPAITIATPAGDVRYRPATVTLSNGIFTVSYLAADVDGVDIAEDCEFQIITEALLDAPDEQASLTAKCALQDAEQGDIGARASLVARAFSPIELVARSLEQLQLAVPKLPAGILPHSAAALLANILGCGELRRDIVERPGVGTVLRHVMVWERLDSGSSQHAQEMLEFIARVPMSAMRLHKLRQQIDSAYELSQHSREALASLASRIDAAVPVKPPGPQDPPAPLISAAGSELITTAAALLSSQDASQLWSAWLATLAVELGSADGASVFWQQGGNFATWQRKLSAVIDDHTAASLLASPQQPALIALGAPYIAAPEDLTDEAAKKVAGEFAELVSRMLTAPETPLLAASLAAQADRQVHDLRIALNGSDGLTAVKARGDDRDLVVALRVDSGDSGHGRSQLRGYAIAIAAGYQRAQAPFDWQWLTNVALQVRDGAFWQPLLNGSEPAPMADTVGATRIHGRDVVVFQYGGLPLMGSLNTLDEGEFDPDGTDALDFYWPQGDGRGHEKGKGAGFWPLPQLAYGLRYFAIAAPIGNAGRILDDRYAATGDDRTLAQLRAAMFAPVAGSLYLCRVAPGAPVISLQDEQGSRGYELANESRTRAYLDGLPQQGGGVDQQRIALIRPAGGAWRAGRDTLTLSLRAPDGTANVIERWLQADWAQRRGGADSGVSPEVDPAVDGLDAAAIQHWQRTYRALLKPPTKAEQAPRTRPQTGAKPDDELERRKAWPRHPAVGAFGIVVTLFNPDGVAQGATHHVLTPARKAALGYLGHGAIKVSAGADTLVSAGDNKTLNLWLAPGWFARIDVCSLAPEEFFSGPPGMARMSDLAAASCWLERGQHYRGYAVATHWVECLPQPLPAPERAKLLAALRNGFEVGPDFNQVVAQIAGGTRVAANWLKGFLVQHHEWHWTGYPVAFPRPAHGDTGLLDWAEPFIGTESLRDSVVKTLSTRINAADSWHTGSNRPEQLVSVRLPPDRGAKYLAFVLRPVRRFDRWLERWPEFDAAIFGEGLLVEATLRWDDPALGLSPPDLKAAVPLVRTFAAEGDNDGADATGGVTVTANGCLLCLRDVLYRTDEMARFGGISETIEVQLEETRLSEVYEVGPNPAFHAAPRGKVDLTLPYPRVFAKDGRVAHADATPDGRLDWRVVADRPFGLSNDLDRNAKVAQTALIVRVDGCDSANYWVMAKIRLRRLYDPDPRWTTPAWVPADCHVPGNWNLGRRAEGDDWIPHDFCVELPDGVPLTGLRVLPGPVLELPATTLRPSLRLRYLCSWHKGQWADTDQSLWGLQVQVQQLFEDKQQWHTTSNFSPHETYDTGNTLDVKNPAPASLQLKAAVPLGKQLVTRLLASDYSAPHWVSFIGMPFRNVALAGETYWLTDHSDGLRLMRANRASGNIELREKGEQVSRDLLLLPMIPADFGAGSHERPVEAESNSFHLLLLFKPVDDVTTAGIGMPLGQLAGVYKPRRHAIDAAHPYPQLWFERLPSSSLDATVKPRDCTAYIYRFHRPHDAGLTPFTCWDELEAAMFPTKDAFGMGPEATVRWTPEYVGPLGVYAAGTWPQDIVKPVAMNGRHIEIRLAVEKPDNKNQRSIDLLVDPAIGWRLKARKDPDNIFPLLVSGSCNAGDSLELMLAGGRLLARLDDWQAHLNPAMQGEALPATMFDEAGKRSPRTFTWSFLE